MNSTRRKFGLFVAAAATARAHDDEYEPVISRTAMINGLASPFAVAGYLMGEDALTRLALARGSMDLRVTHYAPPNVQWSSVVDGLQAATGASLGKMNLQRVDSKATYSLVENRQTGRRVRYELAAAFIKAYADLPDAKLFDAGLEASKREPPEVFRVR